MANLVQLMSIFSRVDPVIRDAIIPHGPAIRGVRSRLPAPGVEVELNPQPLPPRSQLALASADVALRIADAAAAAEAAGEGSASRLIQRVTDEWCGTVPRPRIPWPWPHPWPWPPIRDPEMLGDADIAAARLVGAFALAAAAFSMAEGEARDALARGAERLAETAVGGG